MVLQPVIARVRPRVMRDGSTLSMPLEDEIGELLATDQRVVVQLLGGPVTGKTAALQHLAARFAGEPRLLLRDEAESAVATAPVQVTVMASRIAQPGRVHLRLAAWQEDDVLEYLLPVPNARIATALAAWREADANELGRWPALASRVLDRLAADHARTVGDALEHILDEELSPAERDLARAAALRAACGGRSVMLRPFLEAPCLRALLAAESLVAAAVAARPMPLGRLRWTPTLASAVRERSQHEPEARRLAARWRMPEADMAALLSIACADNAGFRPPVATLTSLDDAHGVGADLHGLTVTSCERADLSFADLRELQSQVLRAHGCRLRGACLDGAQLSGMLAVNLDGRGLRAVAANLEVAWLVGADLTEAVFERASLQKANLGSVRGDAANFTFANLSFAQFEGATLQGADLSHANGHCANFSQVDLRTTRLDGTWLGYARLVQVDLAGTEWPGLRAPNALFEDALLTDSRWRGAQLRGAILRRAGLAGIDWQGADLRNADFAGATFQLGSSRSGLVDSTIASEGSRTGFYTDESLEAHFQAPELVRKANLRDCDLRGAVITGADFYLVDLRGAMMDPEQREWLQKCRAILDPVRVA